MKNLTYLLKIKLYLLLVFISSPNLFGQVTALKVIPEVQQFVAKNGNYTLPGSIQIKVHTGKNDSLMLIATQLKEELQSMLQINASISATSALKAASKNEILISYSHTALKNTEAYTLELDTNTGITIQGASRNGVFWATRTLLQLAKNHEKTIPCGIITDYPDFPNRGFMLDVGRKFFTIDYLRDYVKILSYYKMNEFHVHLNDNGFKAYYDNDWSKTYAAFRLQSDTYPGLAAKDGHYTKEEFRDLQRLGMQYGVNVIPEIDIPAHSLAFTRYNPDLKASAPYADDHLAILDDEKLPHIYRFFNQLFDEYIKGDNPVFIGPDVHIGTDEYIKEGKGRDVDNNQAKRFREFTNYYINYIANSGKTPRLWGGLEWLKDKPLTEVKPAGNAVMNAWSKDWVNAEKMLADGFRIISTPDTWLYIVPAAGYYRDFLDTQWLYTNYRPEKVNSVVTLPNFQPGLLGSTFAVWNDICENGISQLDVHYRTMPAIKVMGSKNWKVAPAKSFEAYQLLAHNSSDGPDVNLSGIYSQHELQAIAAKLGNKAISFNGKKEVILGGTDLGYNYDLSFDIKPKNNNKNNAILFQSSYGTLSVNTNGSEKLGFSRDGYTYTFNFIPNNNRWQTIRLVGDYKSVTLYVDGKKTDHLTAYKKTEGLPKGFNFQQTLTFPLEKIGDAKNGFIGEIRNLQLSYIKAQM
ncbi:hexosaminidase [Saccharicrinis carchari]|uniref:Hexosaminidase n=1 Tax=Saccharicrinis carchari TaxID=1168039 RepID=A0A521AWZ1_SACCC|nr:glycoside hydrolase family 20 protein [Saccharicrinis carchari]SMO39366.1 hexosaminidase [Saccharicrinis carchari]